MRPEYAGKTLGGVIQVGTGYLDPVGKTDRDPRNAHGTRYYASWDSHVR